MFRLETIWRLRYTSALVKLVSIRYYRTMKSKEIHEYLERLSNLMRNESRRVGAEYDLLPIQLEALHYFSLCNRYSDTPMGLTEYLGQTKGSVSQSIKVLEKKGFVRKKPDKNDKRITHLQITRTGRKLLDNFIPAPLLDSACRVLSKNEQTRISNSLETLLRTMQTTNESKSFGVCHTCRHNTSIEGGYRCNLTKEPLSITDVQLICREHLNSCSEKVST